MNNSTQEPLVQPSTPSEIKATMLIELNESMGEGSEELLPELAPLFLIDAPQMILALEQVIIDGDAVKLKELAHTFKGSCASMGIVTLAAHCQELENLGREGKLETAMLSLAHVRAEYEQVKLVLSQYT